MLEFATEQKGAATELQLSGTIDEDDDLAGLAQACAGVKELIVNSKNIVAINSGGVKGWINFFEGLAARGVKLRFVQASPVVVDQMNMITNFAAGGKIESVCVPFNCTPCGIDLIAIRTTEDLKKANLEALTIKCPKCGKSATFNDIPEEYFSFLARI